MHAFGHRTEYVRNYLQHNFLIGSRRALKQIRHRCFCRRFQGKVFSVFMSDLPATSFRGPNGNSYPLKTVGLVYIGPFHIAENFINDEAKYLFDRVLNYSCYACRNDRTPHNGLLRDSYSQVHSTPSSPQRLLSDNATYFIRAKKQLRAEPLSFDKEITSYLNNQIFS